MWLLNLNGSFAAEAILPIKSSGIRGEISKLLLILDIIIGDLWIFFVPLSDRGELLYPNNLIVLTLVA